jgi:hypothetical protein
VKRRRSHTPRMSAVDPLGSRSFPSACSKQQPRLCREDRCHRSGRFEWHDVEVNFAQRLQDEANLAAMPAGDGVSQSHVTWMFGIKNNQRPTRNAEDALIETNSGRMLRNRATIAATMNSPRKGRVE